MKSVIAGVGASDAEDSAQAGRDITAAALSALGGATPRLALLFTTSRHDDEKLLTTIRSALPPDCVLAGGYSVGVITPTLLGYDGYQVALALIAGDSPLADVVFVEGLANREHEAGSELGRKLGHATADGSLLLFYDTVKLVDGKPALNMATPLLAGMSATAKLPDNLAGMGTLGDMQLNPTLQFVNDKLLSSAAVALKLKPPLRMDTVVLHGCRPAGRYYEVTNTDGPVVLELDHRPALDVIAEMLGPEAGLSMDDYALFITLGVNKGDPYAEFKEENYANRMCIAIDPIRRGLVMFENDLVPGMKVQLMRRNVDLSYIPARVKALLDKAAGRNNVMVFYIDCAGRAAAYCGADEEEADAVRRALAESAPGLPILGAYSGVEIARIAGHPQALDWTGVLCLLNV